MAWAYRLLVEVQPNGAVRSCELQLQQGFQLRSLYFVSECPSVSFLLHLTTSEESS
jgi:hypothetical protein